MTLAPLLNAGPLVVGHVAAALAAVLLGAAQLLRRKGDRAHRLLGWIWVALMLVTAGGALWIHTIRTVGPFSPIHLLSLLVLVSAPLAALHARRGRVMAHRNAMAALYLLALVVAGAFTLWPGRIMHAVVLGG